MNCLLYARVSTEDQAELSVPAQLDAMRDYAQQRGWKVLEEFLEPGVSAKTTQRPALQGLLSRVRKNEPKAEIVLVHKVDRLARNVYDHATIKALFQQHGCRLVSVSENIDDTVTGQLVENIMASIAQFYSGNLGEEVKKGMRQKVKNGGWPHLPPLGYILKPRIKAKSTVEIDEHAGPLVRLCFELYATGRWGVRALADHLYKEGLRSRNGHKLAQSNIRKMLANPFYVGRVRWEGKEFPGNHDPLVTSELFELVQKVIGHRKTDPKAALQPTAFPLKVVAVCASCRGKMTAEMHGAWSYYRCCRRMVNKESCPARLTNAKVAHDGLVAICRQLTLSTTLSQNIESAADRILAKRDNNVAEDLARLKASQRRFSQRQQDLTTSFISGKISPGTFESLTAGLKSELKQLEEAIRTRMTSTDAVRGRVKRLLHDAQDVWDLYDRLSPLRQLELLRAVFQTIVLAPAGIVGHVLREPFASIFQCQQDGTTSVPSEIAEACLIATGEPATLNAAADPEIEAQLSARRSEEGENFGFPTGRKSADGTLDLTLSAT